MTISPRVFLAVALLSVTALAQSNPQSEHQKIAETRKAAEQGNAYAQGNLGFAYAKGEGVPQDYAEAARWFRKTAENPNSSIYVLMQGLAQLTLGACMKTAEVFHRITRRR